jgi:hypothetical protein
MKKVIEILGQAQSALEGDPGEHPMSCAKFGFDPNRSDTPHRLEIRSPKLKRAFSKSAQEGKPTKCKKARYRDRQHAKEALKSIRYREGVSSVEAAKIAELPVREYPCFIEGCFGFHLSSKEELASLKRLGFVA